MNYETFMKMLRQKELGLSQRKVAINLNLSRGMLERWWHRTETEWINSDYAKAQTLEQYREYIISVLKVYPQIRATNMYYRLQENFKDFNAKQSTFFRFFDNVRQQSGYGKFKERMIAPREQLPPGYEAQVDFGQFKMKDMYGQTVRVYFFAMVLSYSQMRFAYFENEPFTTITAIKAHNFAFSYFGGRTQTLMYDLDRVFVANENYGDIIYVKQFEDYIKETGISTTMCRPRDPRTKGRVENLIGYIKYSFLEGRTYCGIDSLNSACLKWLDSCANKNVNKITRKPPSELFREENKYMIPVKDYAIAEKQRIVNVTSKNSVIYKENEYAIPRGAVDMQESLMVEENEGIACFYKTESFELICKHNIPKGVGKIVTLDEEYPDKVSTEKLRRHLGYDIRLDNYINNVDSKRFINDHCKALYHMSKYYSAEQLLNALDFSLRLCDCKLVHVAGYLIYKYGTKKARQCFSKEKYIIYSKRAEKIKEELNG